VIALDKNASNQSDQLISRFLADESNDELVKKRHAAAAAKVEADKKAIRISARQKKINKLLASARTAIKEEKILLPEEASAIALYNQVLEISPDNNRALRGLDLCGNLIFEKAKDLYFKDRPDLALQQINFALSKLPGHSKLKSLKNTINASFNPNSSYAKAEKLYLGVDEVQDSSRAAFYYRKAAEGGHPQAMNAMGVAYADGDGVPRSDLRAMDWFEKSAQQENSEAMYNLALGYLFSDQADESKAMVWARQAADKEYRPSYMLISWMTTTGTGAPANRFSSIAWDLKGMVNPISDELHGQYRIPKQWQEKFIREWKKATNTGP
jgi:TPR repeat protein